MIEAYFTIKVYVLYGMLTLLLISGVSLLIALIKERIRKR